MFWFSTCFLFFQSPLALQEFGPFDTSIQSPDQFLGYELGEWHAGPRELIAYAQYIAQSKRAHGQKIGQTFQGLPLYQVAFCQEENWETAIGQQNQSAGRQLVVVQLAYSIHGDEASGAQVALKMLYLLAASQSEWVQNLLAQTVVIIDPTMNPDGLDRFSTWVNSHRGPQPNPDPMDREHQQAWPGGRTNHFWFDLNRDWLPLTQPESQARVAQFQVWRPHIFADFHEMGSQQSFFFQPGDPQRTNPLTPPENQRLTAQIAEFHAQAFDQLAHPYFTREQYDDFFYGKGSTYPDIQGAIGILFEQGSARGHLMRSPYGPRSLAQAMENHLAASLSTLKAAVDLHDQILAYSQSFEALRQKNIQAEKRAGFVFTSRDPYRSKAFVDLLGQHRIKAFRLAKSTSLNSILFEPESSWYVPLDQDQYSLIRTCFERQTEFASQVFYDISGWTLAAAYGLRFAEISKKDAENLAILTYPEPPPNPTPLDPKAVAYVISWEHGLAAPAIADLVQADQKVFTSSEPFQLGTQQFPAGSAWVLQSEVARTRLTAWQSKGLPVFNAASGLTQNGPAWGSPSLHKVEKPKILLLVGEGMSAYDCGELWFHLIQKLGLTPTLLDVSDWSKIDLAEYSHLFLTQWPEVLKVQKESDRIKDWIQAGGQLYAQKSALPELAKLEWSKILLSKAESEGSWKDYREKQRPWSEKESFASEYAVNGLLANVQIDLTNPICFGLEDQSMAFFTQNNRFFEVPKDSFSAPIRFSTDPVYSGYLGKENRERIANSPYLISIRLGSGQILAVQGTPTFRGFCLGSEKIIANLLFQTSP